MNSSSSQKVMMGLSNSPNQSFDLLNPQQEEQHHNRASGDNGEGKEELKEEILPSYDFQSIRPILPPNPVDSPTNSSNVRITPEMDHNPNNSSMVSDIDQTLKKYTDNLLLTLEGISARLSKLEIRTSDIDSSVDELKQSVGNNSGKSKLWNLENILREVQAGVQVLRDKQEIMEALQRANLQASKGDEQSENPSSIDNTDSAPSKVSFPDQSHLSSLPPAAQPPQQLPALPPNPSQQAVQQSPPVVQLPTILPHSQIPPIPQREPYLPTPHHLPEATHQQYQYPTAHQLQAQPPVPHQQSQSIHQLPQYFQQPQPSQPQPHVAPLNPSPQPQPPSGHHPEENPYMPPQRYTPSYQQAPSTAQPHSVPQQLYGAPPNMYDHLPSRHNSGFSSGYDVASGPTSSDSYAYGGSLPQYNSTTMKQPQLSSSAPSSGSSYPRLPIAQILPRALPTASSNDSESSSNGSGKKIPIDDVVDRVVTMGFSREQVNATVKKLTENGQSVDLNVVLDKLMNGEGEVKPQKGWFGR